MGKKSVDLICSHCQDTQVKPCVLSEELTKKQMRRHMACRIWHTQKNKESDNHSRVITICDSANCRQETSFLQVTMSLSGGDSAGRGEEGSLGA